MSAKHCWAVMKTRTEDPQRLMTRITEDWQERAAGPHLCCLLSKTGDGCAYFFSPFPLHSFSVVATQIRFVLLPLHRNRLPTPSLLSTFPSPKLPLILCHLSAAPGRVPHSLLFETFSSLFSRTAAPLAYLAGDSRADPSSSS